MSSSALSPKAYRQVDVETASQGKLVAMLFNGAIQRAEEAKRQLSKQKREGVHNNLIRAQDIIAELRASLNLNAAPIAASIDRLYEYVQHLLIQGNIHKDPKHIDEAVEHMAALRDTWEEAFQKAAKEAPAENPRIDPHGASMLNMQG